MQGNTNSISLLSDRLQENLIHFFLQIIVACIECIIVSHGDEDLLVQWKVTKLVHLDDTGHLVSRMHFHTLTLHVVRIANHRFLFLLPYRDLSCSLAISLSFITSSYSVSLLLFYDFLLFLLFEVLFLLLLSFYRKFILVFFFFFSLSFSLQKLQKRIDKEKILDKNYLYARNFNFL